VLAIMMNLVKLTIPKASAIAIYPIANADLCVACTFIPAIIVIGIRANAKPKLT
jgi:hypothetical protein